MSTPTKEELQNQIRAAVLNQDKARAYTLWRAYQNKEYRLFEPLQAPEAPQVWDVIHKSKTNLTDNSGWTPWDTVVLSAEFDYNVWAISHRFHNATTTFNANHHEAIYFSIYLGDVTTTRYWNRWQTKVSPFDDTGTGSYYLYWPVEFALPIPVPRNTKFTLSVQNRSGQALNCDLYLRYSLRQQG